MSKRNDWIPQWALQQDLNGITENAVFPEHMQHGGYEPKTLVDETLETIDPTPNVHTLFVQFNEKYFWNKLLPVQVRWSQRMTTCAGTCSFHPRNRECVIALSAPLLKLRPRKDLVETLLHEMIHGYLFLTNNNRDRDGHGPEFCKHMDRINRDAGTNITIYHTFHDEVRLYQQHWWRCNGPCQNRPPYFGTVRRAMNRAPGPSDFWFNSHQLSCGGVFIKVREPDPKPKTKTNKEIIKSPVQSNTMDKYISSNNSKNLSKNIVEPSKKSCKNCKCKKKKSEEIKKLGTNTNNVYGFGTGGPGSSTSSIRSKDANFKSPTNFKFSGVVGGNATGRSNLLEKYFSSPAKQTQEKRESVNENSVQCPICKINIPNDLINNHIDICLIQENDNNTPPVKRSKLSNPNDQSNNSNINENKDNFGTCPICQKTFPNDVINIHLDECLHEQNERSNTQSTVNNKNTELINNPDLSRSFHECPICNDFFTQDKIQDHVNECLLNNGEDEENHKRTKNTAVDLSVSPIKDKTDRHNITCPTCNKTIKVVNYYAHVEKCLAMEYEKASNDRDNIIVLDDDINKPGSSKQINKINDKYECLVCNEMISKSIPLNEHLDSCISITYCDTSVMDTTVEKSPLSIVEDDEDMDEDERHLCPICMKMIEDKLMAKHVDDCIKNIN
ncbi:hypothetical protein PV326_006501 [Microctonus aethiopoides]|nr:hypothetical protein PV326_006501 [Microctonus aethiopoides]